MPLAAYGSHRKLLSTMVQISQSQGIRIRPAARQDAAVVAAMVNKLNVLHDKPEDCDAAAILRDGFDTAPGFSVLLAEEEGQAIGYALYHAFYNTDVPGWGLWLADLFVEEDKRSRGAGRMLLAAVAAEAVAAGRVSVAWGVMSENLRARSLYALLGAREEGAQIVELDGPALIELGNESSR